MISKLENEISFITENKKLITEEDVIKYEVILRIFFYINNDMEHYLNFITYRKHEQIMKQKEKDVLIEILKQGSLLNYEHSKLKKYNQLIQPRVSILTDGLKFKCYDKNEKQILTLNLEDHTLEELKNFVILINGSNVNNENIFPYKL